MDENNTENTVDNAAEAAKAEAEAIAAEAAEAKAKAKAEAKAAKNAGKVKVIANYGVRDERITLWGIDFVQEDDQYTAELPEEQAAELIEAGRAVKA